MERKIIETINTKVIIGAVILLYLTKGWHPFQRIERYFTIQNMIIFFIVYIVFNNLSTKNINKVVDLFNFQHKYFGRPLFYISLLLFIYILIKKKDTDNIKDEEKDKYS